MDDLLAFVRAVRTMRRAQKDYFASRAPYRLNAAKAAEAEVDKLLNVLDDRGDVVQNNTGQQGNLFDQTI